VVIINNRPGAREIQRNITLSDDISEGNIITEGNISPNPPSGRSIIDILYRKFKQGWMFKGKQVHDFALNGGCNL
jgi:hypothetical protein